MTSKNEPLDMTLTTTIDGSKEKIDWTKPVLSLVAVCWWC